MIGRAVFTKMALTTGVAAALLAGGSVVASANGTMGPMSPTGSAPEMDNHPTDGGDGGHDHGGWILDGGDGDQHHDGGDGSWHHDGGGLDGVDLAGVSDFFPWNWNTPYRQRQDRLRQQQQQQQRIQACNDAYQADLAALNNIRYTISNDEYNGRQMAIAAKYRACMANARATTTVVDAGNPLDPTYFGDPYAFLGAPVDLGVPYASPAGDFFGDQYASAGDPYAAGAAGAGVSYGMVPSADASAWGFGG
jgi:hypothetical protein